MSWQRTVMLALGLLTAPIFAWDSVHRSQRTQHYQHVNPASPQKQPYYYYHHQQQQQQPDLVFVPSSRQGIPQRDYVIREPTYWTIVQRQPVFLPINTKSFQAWENVSGRTLQLPSNTPSDGITAWGRTPPAETRPNDDVSFRHFGGKHKLKKERNKLLKHKKRLRANQHVHRNKHDSKRQHSPKLSRDGKVHKNGDHQKSKHHQIETLELKDNRRPIYSAEDHKEEKSVPSTRLPPRRHEYHRRTSTGVRKRRNNEAEPIVFTLPDKDEGFYRYKGEDLYPSLHHPHRAPGYRIIPGKTKQDEYEVNFLASNNYYKYNVPVPLSYSSKA